MKAKYAPDFKGAKYESKQWTSGMAGQVTDKDAAKRIGKASKKDTKQFMGSMKSSLLWEWY